MLFIRKNRSKTTVDNAKWCKKIIQQLVEDSFLLLTSKYHMKRALIIFKHFYKKYDIIPVVSDYNASSRMKMKEIKYIDDFENSI